MSDHESLYAVRTFTVSLYNCWRFQNSTQGPAYQSPKQRAKQAFSTIPHCVKAELDGLRNLKAAKCSFAPVLISDRVEKQCQKGFVPDGFLDHLGPRKAPSMVYMFSRHKPAPRHLHMEDVAAQCSLYIFFFYSFSVILYHLYSVSRPG